MRTCNHHKVVMCEDVAPRVVHRVVTMQSNPHHEDNHEEDPIEAHEARTYNGEITSIEEAAKVAATRTEVIMEADIVAILILTTDAGLSEATQKVEIEMVSEEEHGGDQVEGPTTTEVIEMITTDLIPMLTVVRSLLLLHVPLRMMQELTTFTQAGMTGGMIMALTSRSKITIGTPRMTLHTTSRSVSHTAGKTTTVVSVKHRLS